MEHLAQRSADRAVVRVGRHDLDILLPPLLADLGYSDGRPLFFVFDLRVAEELMRFRIQEDREARDARGFS